MRKLFTFISFVLLSASLFAATEQAWYNDVTSITANGQYYIYSVKGAGFMQAGKSTVQSITTSNYTNVSTFKFKITKAEDGNVINGNYYLKSYRAALGSSNSGPVCTNNSDDGTTIIWTSMESGLYWNIHGHYDSFGNRCACLKYQDKYDGYIPSGSILNGGFSITKDPQTGAEYRWYLVSQAQLDRHFAIYFFDAYKENCNIAQYENHVPAAYYTALQTAYNKTFSVQKTAHSADVVNAAKADLETLYTGAPAIKTAYETAKGKIDALEAVEDKGEDFSEVTNDITNARTALEAAMTVDAVNASVAGLKAIDPITFTQTEFEALNFVTNASSTAAGREITYAAENKSVINAEGKAIYKGATKLTATAAATDAYYKFVRSAQVTVSAPDTYGAYEAQFCQGSSVEFEGVEYKAPTTEPLQIKLAQKNYLGGDSIVALTVVELPIYEIAEEKTVYQNEAYEWQGQVRPTDVIGEFNFTAPYTTVEGCDSTYTLALKVIERPTTYGVYEASICEGDSVEYAGTWYYDAAKVDITLDEKNVYGGDSIVTLTVSVLPVDYVELRVDSLHVGDTLFLGDGLWYLVDDEPELLTDTEYEMTEERLFDITMTATNQYGCDSVIVRHVVVEAKPVEPETPTAIDQYEQAAPAVKELRNGVLYIRRNETLYTTEGRKVE